MGKIKYVIIFLVVFALGLALVKGVDRIIANSVIARDSEMLASKFQMYITESAEQILEMPRLDPGVTCTAELESLLKQKTFDSSFVRWLAIYKDNQVLCQSGVIPHDLTALKAHKVRENLSIAVASHNTQTSHELFLMRHMEGIDYIASITPLRPRYFVPVDCERCLEYKVSLDSDPYIEFGFDNFADEPVVYHVVKEQNPYYHATFELSGNRVFLEQYSQLGWRVSVATGIVLGLLACLVYWRWNNHQISLDSQIKRGIQRGEFIPYYQPIVDSSAGMPVGAEVLVRWLRHDNRMIPPNQFIPFAEARGHILPMTTSMLNKVINDIQLLGEQCPPLFFSINIVPAHLENDDFYHQLQEIVESGMLGHHRLSLEITERLPIKDMTLARQTLDKIYALGIDLKLDDAGTGYGCFSYVQHLGISTLKIDKMFVDTIGQSHNFNGKTLDAIISFANESKLHVIAEGVETVEQQGYLGELGVKLIQGYYYSKPLATEDFFKFTLASGL